MAAASEDFANGCLFKVPETGKGKAEADAFIEELADAAEVDGEEPSDLLAEEPECAVPENVQEPDEQELLRALPCAGNQFERFRGFLELTSRFEFDFCRCGNYLFERFEFLVCSKFNHTQCGRTRACAVACLCPHNSITNFVVSLTTHDNMYSSDVAKT